MSNILCNNISRDVTIGIDLFSFEVAKNQPFHGIVNIPHFSDADAHVIHFQHKLGYNGTEDDTGLRYGYWFTKGDYYFIFNEDSETFEMFEESDEIKYNNARREYANQKTILQYPKIEEQNDWDIISNFINWRSVYCIANCDNSLANTKIVYVDSSMSTIEESKLLEKTLKQESDQKYDGKIFHYTEINFKTSEAIRDNYQMEDYLDKSYYFNAVILKKKYNNKIENYFGEMQFSYLNAILFGNYGSSLQWHTMIELICKSSKIELNILKIMDEILSTELRLLPIEYSDILINDKMWINIFDSSFHKDDLPLTEKTLKEKNIIQDSTNSNDHPDSDNGIDDGGNHSDVSFIYHGLDSSDEEDEYKPTVVSGIYYR